MDGKPVPIIVWTALAIPPLVQAAIRQVGASGWLFKQHTRAKDFEQAIRSAVAAPTPVHL
jgi:hypothetical protein